jgi:hypothetical protein
VSGSKSEPQRPPHRPVEAGIPSRGGQFSVVEAGIPSRGGQY